MRVLVVDDDELSGEVIVAILQEGGYTTVMVDSAMEALDTLASGPAFDAVVSDKNMPLISGIELFTMLREEGYRMPFLLLSGESPNTHWQRDPHLDACIAKDGQLERTLLRTLARVLEARA